MDATEVGGATDGTQNKPNTPMLPISYAPRTCFINATEYAIANNKVMATLLLFTQLGTFIHRACLAARTTLICAH